MNVLRFFVVLVFLGASCVLPCLQASAEDVVYLDQLFSGTTRKGGEPQPKPPLNLKIITPDISNVTAEDVVSAEGKPYVKVTATIKTYPITAKKKNSSNSCVVETLYPASTNIIAFLNYRFEWEGGASKQTYTIMSRINSEGAASTQLVGLIPLDDGYGRRVYASLGYYPKLVYFITAMDGYGNASAELPYPSQNSSFSSGYNTSYEVSTNKVCTAAASTNARCESITNGNGDTTIMCKDNDSDVTTEDMLRHFVEASYCGYPSLPYFTYKNVFICKRFAEIANNSALQTNTNEGSCTTYLPINSRVDNVEPGYSDITGLTGYADSYYAHIRLFLRGAFPLHSNSAANTLHYYPDVTLYFYGSAGNGNSNFHAFNVNTMRPISSWPQAFWGLASDIIWDEGKVQDLFDCDRAAYASEIAPSSIVDYPNSQGYARPYNYKVQQAISSPNVLEFIIPNGYYSLSTSSNQPNYLWGYNDKTVTVYAETHGETVDESGKKKVTYDWTSALSFYNVNHEHQPKHDGVVLPPNSLGVNCGGVYAGGKCSCSYSDSKLTDYCSLSWQPGKTPYISNYEITRRKILPGKDTGDVYLDTVDLRTFQYSDRNLPLDGATYEYKVAAVQSSGRKSEAAGPVTCVVSTAANSQGFVDYAGDSIYDDRCAIDENE